MSSLATPTTVAGPGAATSPAAPASGPLAIPLMGAFESTYMPALDIDVAETTEHTRRWRQDIALLRSTGVSSLRYPVRWHRVETEPGRFDWSDTDVVLSHMAEGGLEPVVDLVHHTSYPRWIGSFADPGFGPALLRYVEAFARRYPDVKGYTVFNEPFTTFLLCGQEGIWPPHLKGLEGFLQLARNVLPFVAEASLMLADLLPAARHLYVEVCEGHTASTPEGEPVAAFADDRRFLLTDLFVGRAPDPDRPFVQEVLAAGGEDLLTMEPGSIDVLGLDYYAHCQWDWSGPGRGSNCSPHPRPLAQLIAEYWERYGLPCVLGETNIRGFASDRASWLKYTLEQCQQAKAAGIPVEGYCWFPFVDSCDWGSLLCRGDGHVDPVGVYWLDGRLDRRPSSMSAAFAIAAAGAPASALPAYRFQPPVSRWLEGWMPQMQHWDWEPPPPGELETSTDAADHLIELKVRDAH